MAAARATSPRPAARTRPASTRRWNWPARRCSSLVASRRAGRRRQLVRVLALDLGSKRIGVAVSDLTGTVASPLTVLERSKSRRHDHERIAALVARGGGRVGRRRPAAQPVRRRGTGGPGCPDRGEGPRYAGRRADRDVRRAAHHGHRRTGARRGRRARPGPPPGGRQGRRGRHPPGVPRPPRRERHDEHAASAAARTSTTSTTSTCSRPTTGTRIPGTPRSASARSSRSAPRRGRRSGSATARWPSPTC